MAPDPSNASEGGGCRAGEPSEPPPPPAWGGGSRKWSFASPPPPLPAPPKHDNLFDRQTKHHKLPASARWHAPSFFGFMCAASPTMTSTNLADLPNVNVGKSNLTGFADEYKEAPYIPSLNGAK